MIHIDYKRLLYYAGLVVGTILTIVGLIGMIIDIARQLGL